LAAFAQRVSTIPEELLELDDELDELDDELDKGLPELEDELLDDDPVESAPPQAVNSSGKMDNAILNQWRMFDTAARCTRHRTNDAGKTKAVKALSVEQSWRITRTSGILLFLVPDSIHHSQEYVVAEVVFEQSGTSHFQEMRPTLLQKRGVSGPKLMN
jgi:hypothetical protein